VNDPVARLLALAEADASVRTLEGRLSDLDREEEHLRDRLADEDEAFHHRQANHRALRLSALAKSGEVDATDEKIRTYQRKLDHDIIPYREMEHLREQVTSLRARMDTLADEALRLMAEADADEEKLQTETVEHTERRVRLEEDLAAVGRQRSATVSKKEALLGTRGELLQQVPPHLRQQYERLLGAGTPVVAVLDGRCGGCQLRLAEATMLRVKAGREAATCEHCSRFLYLRPY